MTVICSWQTLKSKGTVRFVHEGAPCFAVFEADQAFGYYDQCPHTQACLDGGEVVNAYLTREHDAIICGWHGALFRKSTGVCFAGPCAGKNLRTIAIKRDGDDVVISV